MDLSLSLAQFESDLAGLIRAPAFSEPQFEALALRLFAFQYQAVPLYRAFCDATDSSPPRVSSWRKIPALPVRAFKDFDVSSLAPTERTTVFHSSGTTGSHSSRHFHSPASLAQYERSAASWFQTAVLSRSSGPIRFISLTPPPEQAPHSSLVHMFDTFRRHCAPSRFDWAGETTAGGAWRLVPERALAILESAQESDSRVSLLGTAFLYVHLADLLAASQQNLRLPEGSWALETGGYKGRSRTLSKSDLYRLIQSSLGIASVISEYGMCELSSQAYGIENMGQPLQFPPWCAAHIFSPETGQPIDDAPGLLHVLDLANTRSVSAIQTEDLARSSGPGFELEGRAPAAEPRGCSLLAASLSSAPS